MGKRKTKSRWIVMKGRQEESREPCLDGKGKEIPDDVLVNV